MRDPELNNNSQYIPIFSSKHTIKAQNKYKTVKYAFKSFIRSKIILFYLCFATIYCGYFFSSVIGSRKQNNVFELSV